MRPWTSAFTRSTALVSSLLAACSPTTPAAETNSANISGYNHTADYIHQFYVDGTWGGNVFAYSGGGKFVCCLLYPKHWHEGLKATVRWTTSTSDPNGAGESAVEKWHEIAVPVERYEAPGTTLNVHFLTEGKVRLIISSSSSRDVGYPGPRLEPKPKDFKW